MKPLLKMTMIVSAFAFAGTASASDYGYSSASGLSGTFHQTLQAGPLDHLGGKKNLKGASETASFNFRKGVKAYDTNNFEKAETSFKAALRAQSAGLEPEIYLYLAKISQASGNIKDAAEFAQKYNAAITTK